MKEAYEQKLQAQLEQWRAEVDLLTAKAAGARADAKIEIGRELDHLRGKQQDAERRLSELKSAGDDAWKDLKAGIEGSWQALAEAVESAASRFK